MPRPCVGAFAFQAFAKGKYSVIMEVAKALAMILKNDLSCHTKRKH